MSISLICAVDENGAIGLRQKLLYNIKEDLQRFKQITSENKYDDKNYILMGRSTYESLPNALEGRINVIATRNVKYHPRHTNGQDVMLIHNLDRVLNHYHESGGQLRELFVIGGEKIYRQAIKYADNIYLTIIHDNSKKADAYFPMNELVNFNLDLSSVERHYSEKYGVEYSFMNFKRKVD